MSHSDSALWGVQPPTGELCGELRGELRGVFLPVPQHLTMRIVNTFLDALRRRGYLELLLSFPSVKHTYFPHTYRHFFSHVRSEERSPQSPQ